MRVQKRLSFSERHRVTLSAEIFNVFNFENIEFAGSTVQNYCVAPVPLECGFLAPSNPNFLQLIDRNPASTRFGKVLLNNNPILPAFQLQFGARYQF